MECPTPAGQRPLFEGRRSCAGCGHCAPAALALAGLYPHRAAHGVGGCLFLPPGTAVRTGLCRMRGAHRAFSGCHCRYRMGALRGKRMAAARPQQLHPGHTAAAPAGHHPPHRGPFCCRDRGSAGADPVLTAGRAGHRRTGHHGPDGAGTEHPYPASLFHTSFLVDGQRGRTHVQLDQLVHPECSAHGLSAAHHTVRAESRCQTGCIQSGLLFEGLRPGRLLQRGCAVLPPRRTDPVGLP